VSEVETNDESLNHNKTISEILEETYQEPDNLKSIAGDILVEASSKPSRKTAKNSNLSDSEKVQIIKSLADLFIDLRLEPQFQLKWVLAYTQALKKLKADSYLRLAFARWSWTSLAEAKTGADELAEVEPNAVLQLADEMANDHDWFKNDTAKV